MIPHHSVNARNWIGSLGFSGVEGQAQWCGRSQDCPHHHTWPLPRESPESAEICSYCNLLAKTYAIKSALIPKFGLLTHIFDLFLGHRPLERAKTAQTEAMSVRDLCDLFNLLAGDIFSEGIVFQASFQG